MSGFSAAEKERLAGVVRRTGWTTMTALLSAAERHLMRGVSSERVVAHIGSSRTDTPPGSFAATMKVSDLTLEETVAVKKAQTGLARLLDENPRFLTQPLAAGAPAPPGIATPALIRAFVNEQVKGLQRADAVRELIFDHLTIGAHDGEGGFIPGAEISFREWEDDPSVLAKTRLRHLN